MNNRDEEKLILDGKWRDLRHETPGASNVAHFNNAGAGLMPDPVVKAITDHIQLEAALGGYEAARARSSEIAKVYESLGATIGAGAKNIALTANATDAYARALSSIPFKAGDVIIGAWSEYASNQIQFLSMAKRLGVEIVRAPITAAGITDLDKLDELIRAKKPKLVASVHINTSSGVVESVEAIGEICRRHNVFYLVDGCQSFGQGPIDVGKIGCDFFSATSRKFLRGPRGAGLLFISDRILDDGLAPMFVDLTGAELHDAETFKVVGSAKRFEDWESSFAVLLGFGAAADYALNIGLQSIATRLDEVTVYLRRKLGGLNSWRILDAGQGTAPIIPVYSEQVPGDKANQILSERKINTTLIPKKWAPMDGNLVEAGWAIRISPHYYTSPEDIDALLEALEAAAS